MKLIGYAWVLGATAVLLFFLTCLTYDAFRFCRRWLVARRECRGLDRELEELL